MRRRSRYGWLELIEGILLILLGIYTLCNPGGMLRGITFAYGLLAVITGISDIVFYAKTERAFLGYHRNVRKSNRGVSELYMKEMRRYGEISVTVRCF